MPRTNQYGPGTKDYAENYGYKKNQMGEKSSSPLRRFCHRSIVIVTEPPTSLS